MTEPTNGDIMRLLGKLEANTSNIASNATEEARRAQESRRALHEKIDETNSTVSKVADQLQETAFQLRVTTDIAVQARDGLSAFRAKFEKEAAPVLEGVETFHAEVQPLLDATRTVRNWAAFFAVLAGLGVVSVGTALAFFNDAAKIAVKQWLGI